jgi:hypothetical protein
MHIHASHTSTPQMFLAASQSTQRTLETKKAAEAVSKKLSSFASSAEGEEFPRIDASYSSSQKNSSQGQKDEPSSDPEAFRRLLAALA